MTSSLRFDEQIVDIKMAKEYLQKNKEFHSIGYADNEKIENDAYSNKIFLSSYEYLHIDDLNISVNENTTKLMYLAEKITKNADLFCQLEYLIRKKPIDEVRNFDIKLLTQNLIYQSSFEEAEKVGISEIYMTDDTPLATLGCVAQSMSPRVTVVSTKETAAICSLFVNLCHEAGLQDVVYLVLVSRLPKLTSTTVTLSAIEELRTGCVGIVTEKADIDSAVDTFLYATSRYPWHIKKIFVQESVLNNFKRSIEWKTKNPAGEIDEQLLRSCTSVYVYEDKIYLFEFAGNIKNITPNSIIIEAYRTNKELITLMSAIKLFCVSIWSSNVAESNEIAFGVNANIVWINDYGYFDGPPVTSQGFYSLLYKDLGWKVEALISKSTPVLKRRDTWMKSDEATRYIKIWKILENFRNEFNTFRSEMRIKHNHNSTISIGNKFCIATRKPVNVLFVIIKNYLDSLKYMNFIIDGGAVVFIAKKSNVDEILKWCTAFKDIDAPVLLLQDDTTYDKTFEGLLQYTTKVVWSSIGTIFAN